MEFTIQIREKKDIISFLNLIKKFDFVEIIDLKEDSIEVPDDHIRLLDERLKLIDEGKTSFRNWELIKSKYEGKVI